MSSNEQKLLIETARDFIEKDLIPIYDKIEKNGIDSDLISKLAENGYIGANLPESEGGVGLDDASYILLLEEFSKYVPSIALFIFIQNNIAIPLLKLSENKEIALNFIEEIIKGKIHASIALEDLTNYKRSDLRIYEDNRIIKGNKEYVLNSNANILLSLSDNGENLVYLKSSYLNKIEYRKLGFRALSFSKVLIDAKLDENPVLITRKASNILSNLYEESGAYIASIALGMSKEAINKAKEYSKKREAFGKLLHEFQPISFAISQIEVELEALENYLDKIVSIKDKSRYTGIKILTCEFSRKVAKLSLQVHGGYGYFEDFKVERIYRDSMALSILFSNFIKDRVLLSKYLIDPKSAEY